MNAVIRVSNSRALIKMSPPMTRHGQPVSRAMLRGVMTDDIIEALQKHNQAKTKALIEQMGNKWLCHKDNFIKRKDGKVYK